MTHNVIIALGTNIDKQLINNAYEELKKKYPDIKISNIIATVPIGDKFHGKKFHNAIATLYTSETADKLICRLKSIELLCGDSCKLREEGVVALDIDLLKHNNKIYHNADWERNYIKRLMAEFIKPNCT